MLKYREFPIKKKLIELYRLIEVVPYNSDEHNRILDRIDRLENIVE